MIEWFMASRGEFAALGAAICWVFTSLWFAAAGRRIGAIKVNLFRIWLALGMLAIIHRVQFGVWWPDLDAGGLTYLAVSGVIGLVIGDQLLFIALVDVGSRLATLLMTLAPPVTTVLAWIVLNEHLGPAAILGIAITVSGIAWVVIERPAGAQAYPHRHRVRGITFGLIAGVCQAIGLILAKLGMGHTPDGVAGLVDPWSATLVRMAFSAVGISLLVGLLRARSRPESRMAMDISPETEHVPPLPAKPRSIWPMALLCVLLGSIAGPVLGVWLSMVGVDEADAGVAATLMSMSPVFILPFAVWVEKEHLSWRAILGALVAVGGVAVLTLAPQS